MSTKSAIHALLFAFLISAVFVGEASAQRYRAVAANFVGTGVECSPAPAGNKIVSSAWVNGLGLPDNGTSHPDGGLHQGLLLSKNGPTANCSSATATITVDGDDDLTGDIVTLDKLGFDYRNGTSCGAGAPRFNVYTTSGTVFVGCSSGTPTPAPQDTGQWTRVTHTGLGLTGVTGIQIIFDEGTDTPLPPDAPAGPGLVTLDNIRINNTVITRKSGNVFIP